MQAIRGTIENQNRVVNERMEQLKPQHSSDRDWMKNNLQTYQDQLHQVKEDSDKNITATRTLNQDTIQRMIKS